MTEERTPRGGADAAGHRDAPAYLEVLGVNVGRQVPLDALRDPEVVRNRAVLKREGVLGAGVSDLALADLVDSVLPDLEQTRVDWIVIATNSTEGHSSESMRAAVSNRLPRPFPLRITHGYECANVAPTLQECHRALTDGAASRILVVFVEKVDGEARFTPVSNSLYSDVAVACIVSGQPGPRTYRLDAVELEPSQTTSLGSGHYADARNTMVAMRAAARRALGPSPDEALVDVLTLNLGATARQLLMMSASLPQERLRAHPGSAFGHSFGADLLIGLAAIDDSGAACPEQILALGSSKTMQSAMLLTRDA